MFSPQKLNLVKNRIDIVDLVGQRVTLRKKGNSYVGLCPFHADVHPSLSVSGQKQLFKCFSCGVGGDVFQFWSKINQFSFDQSVVALANRAGVKITSYVRKPHWSDQQQKILKINHDFMRYCFNFLFSDNANAHATLSYLEKRNLQRPTITKFKIGLCPGGSQIINFLFEQNYTLNELNDSGLVQVIENRKFCPFAERIVFPIFNAENMVVGFSTRTLNPKNSSKYINNADTPVFRKSSAFYNWGEVANNPVSDLIICEGVFDVLTLTQADITNCVGLLGTNLSSNHIKILTQKKCSVLLWLDNDRAGQLATFKIARQLLINKIKVKIYPTNSQMKDPADIVNQPQFNQLPPGQWLHPAQFAMNLFRPQLNLQQPASVQSFITNVAQLLQFETKPVIFNSFIQQLSKLVQLPVTVLRESISPRKQHSTTHQANVTITHHQSGLTKAQRRLLWLGWNRRQDFYQIETVITAMQEDHIQFGPSYNAIWGELKRYYDNQSPEQTQNIVDLSPSQQEKIFSPKVMSQITSILQNTKSCSHRWDNRQEIRDCALKIKKDNLRAEIIKINKQKKKVSSSEQKMKLSNQIIMLNQKIYKK